MRIFLSNIYIHRMNAVMQLLRKNVVLIAAIVLVCLLSFVTVQYGSSIMSLLKGNKNEENVTGTEEVAAAGAPVASEVDAVSPPEDERPGDGACGSAKKVTFDVAEDKVEGVGAFDPSEAFSNVAADATKEANSSEGLIDKLSQVLA